MLKGFENKPQNVSLYLKIFQYYSIFSSLTFNMKIKSIVFSNFFLSTTTIKVII